MFYALFTEGAGALSLLFYSRKHTYFNKFVNNIPNLQT